MGSTKIKRNRPTIIKRGKKGYMLVIKNINLKIMKCNCGNCKYWIKDDSVTMKIWRSHDHIDDNAITGKCQKAHEMDYYKNYKPFHNDVRMTIHAGDQPSEEFVDFRKGASVFFGFGGEITLSTFNTFNCNDYGHNNYEKI